MNNAEIYQQDCELLKMQCVIGEGESTVNLNSSVELERRARRIKDIRASIENVRCEVGDGEAIITGTIHKQIFAVSRGSNRVFHTSEEVSFGTAVEIPGALPDMECQAFPRIVRIIPELDPSGRVVNQTIVLRVFAKVWETCQLNVVIDEDGPLLKTQEVVAERTVSTRIEHVEDIQASRIMSTQVELLDVASQVQDGQVQVQGTLEKEICYVDEDDCEICEDFVIPFEETVSLAGVERGMHSQVQVSVLEPETRLIFEEPDDEISEEALDRISLEIFVKVSRSVQANVGVDEKGPLVKSELVIAEDVKQLILEDVICIPEGAQKIFDINAVVKDLECEIIPDKVVVKGNLHKQIFYVDEDDCVSLMRADIPFSTFVEVPGAEPGMNCQPHAAVEFISPTLVRETEDCPACKGDDDLFFALRERAVLEIFVKISEEVQLNVALCPKK